MFLIKCGKILDPLCSSQKLVWLANLNFLVAIYRVAVLSFGLPLYGMGQGCMSCASLWPE